MTPKVMTAERMTAKPMTQHVVMTAERMTLREAVIDCKSSSIEDCHRLRRHPS
jgi:hypothetical protein